MQISLTRFSKISICLSCFALSACDNSEAAALDALNNGDPSALQLAQLEANTTLTSGFGTPNSIGAFEASLATIFKGGFEDSAGNGYAFEIGRDETAFSAYVGLLPATDVGALPAGGLATMSGTYHFVEVGKSDGDIRAYGQPVTTTGRINLRADFDFNTLSGTDGTLIVDGTFAGKTLAGRAFFNDQQATLGGEIGNDRAVGIFHGTDDATAYVGGFLVER